METATLDLKPTEPTEPNLETMKRADLPAIWSDFREKIAALKTTAETLTVTDESDKAGMKLARATRLALREIRIAVEARRKELGEEALRRKQGIDADAKAIKELIEPLETRLLECEEFAARAEANRAAAKLAERTAAVVSAKGDPTTYNLAGCTDEAFAEIIASLELAEKARIEVVKKAEAELLAKIEAENAERERIRLENIRLAEEAAKLRAEAEAREKAAAEERKAAAEAAEKLRKETEAREAAAAKAAAEKLRIANEKAKAEREEAEERARVAAEVARKEREAIEDKARKEAASAQKAREEEQARFEAESKKQREEATERERVIQARAIEAQRIADENARAQAANAAKLAAELAAKKDAEKKAADEKSAAEKAAAAAPDKAKLSALAADIRALKIPEVSDTALRILIGTQREKFAAWIESQAQPDKQ